MRLEEITLCDGCGYKISHGVEKWEWDRVVEGMVVQTHPNNRCASAAERKLRVVLR